MAVDTPATIAVIGAGPIGLEAGLYARFLGYDVQVFERGRVVEQLLRWGDVRFETPWKLNASPLGLAALRTQDASWQTPADDDLLTAAELAAVYYQPLAASDLLVDRVHIETEVVSIARPPLAEGEVVEEDDVLGFQLKLRDATGERQIEADVVIDASGLLVVAGERGSEQAGADSLTFGLDAQLHRALQLAAGAGQGSAAAEQGADSRDPQRLLTAEPDFYILGSKSGAAGWGFPIYEGLRQIRDLFTIIGDRPTLDLYSTTGAWQ
jgi:hypothetical protein